jgi:hypothetical protein
VDPYVHTFKDTDTNNIFTQLSNLASAGGKVAVVAAVAAEEQGARNWRQAVTETDSSPVGPALDPAPRDPQTLLGRVFTSAYQAGFDRIDGQFLGGQAAQDYAVAAEQLKDAPHDQLKAKFGEIRTKYMGSMISNEQRDAFLPRAAHAEEKLLGNHLVYGVEQAHIGLLEKAKSSVRTSMMAGLGSVLGQLDWTNKETGVTKTLELPDLEHPDALQVFLDNKEQLQGDIDKVMQSAFDESHAYNQGALSRPETTGLVLSVAKSIAENTNAEEVLNFAYTPNAQGQAIVDYNDASGPVSGPIDRARQQAFDGRYKNMRIERALRHERITETFHRGQTDWMINISNIHKISNDTERKAALNKAESDLDVMIRKTDGIIGKEEYIPMRGMLKEMTEQNYHPKTTDEKHILDLQERIGAGTLTVKYVYSKRADLDYNKFMHYMQRGSEVEHGQATKNASEKAKVFGPAQRLHQWIGQNAAQMYDPKDVWGTGSIYDDGPDALNSVRNWIYVEGAGREEKLGRSLNYEESEQLIQDALLAKPPKKEPSMKDINDTIADMVKKKLIPEGVITQAWYTNNIMSFTPMQRFALNRVRSIHYKAYLEPATDNTTKPK